MGMCAGYRYNIAAELQRCNWKSMFAALFWLSRNVKHVCRIVFEKLGAMTDINNRGGGGG